MIDEKEEDQGGWGFHCALEAVLMVEAGIVAVVTALCSAATCRLSAPAAPAAPPADTRLTGLLVSSDRFCGFRKSGAVTRFGVLPALAKSKFPLPSRDVMGRVPLEARAMENSKSTIMSLIRLNVLYGGHAKFTKWQAYSIKRI